MSSWFKNPWAKNGELFPSEVLENILTIKGDNLLENFNISQYKGLADFGTNGFTKIKLIDSTIVSIPVYTKISNLKFNIDKSREEFILEEWPYKNKLGSVKCEPNGTSRFTNISYQGAATIYFNKANGELKLGTGVIVSAYTSASDPIPNGTHNIWLPDYPHNYGYSTYSKNADIWFRLGDESSHRYLHLGSVSLGCVSVGKSSANDNSPEFTDWDLVYNYLSKRRSSSKHVGVLIVT